MIPLEPAPGNGATAGDLSIVCCVESGPLEHQTVRLVESLRRWGGRLAGTPMLAVTPRLGPPLLRSTRAVFDRLEVDYLRFRGDSPYLWQHYMNKPLAISAAAERAQTPLLAWFDSDMVVVAEPESLLPGPHEDFVASARDRGVIGSTGADDERDAYWAAVCRIAGVDLDALPWVRTHEEGLAIRMYWNSGLFVFRRNSGLADDYLRLSSELLASRVGTVSNRLQFNDQVALGLSVARMGLRWRPLDHHLNYGVSRWHADDPAGVAAARIIHYHDSLAPDFFDELVRRIEPYHPEPGRWLRSKGPLPRPGPMLEGARQALRAARSLRRRRFYRTCRWI